MYKNRRQNQKLTSQGLVGVVEAVGGAVEVGGAVVGGRVGSWLLLGSNKHALEKEMSSTAINPCVPFPC